MHDRDGAQALFNRLGRDFVRILDERTGDGYVFRTDLRLRPDPRRNHSARHRATERTCCIGGDEHASLRLREREVVREVRQQRAEDREEHGLEADDRADEHERAAQLVPAR